MARKERKDPLAKGIGKTADRVTEATKNIPGAREEMARATGMPNPEAADEQAALALVLTAVKEQHAGYIPGDAVQQLARRVLDIAGSGQEKAILRAARDAASAALHGDPELALQELTWQRRHRGAYHTRTGPATTAAHLIINEFLAREGRPARGVRAADFCCGSGALLVPAAEELERAGGTHILIGTDISPLATAMTADKLNGRPGIIPVIANLPYGNDGRGNIALGALELLLEGGHRPETDAWTGRPIDPALFADESLDIVIMNAPAVGPFDHRALATGQMTQAEEKQARDRLKRIAGTHRLRTKMGPAAFLAIAGLRKLRRGGHIALILPTGAVSGAGVRERRNGGGETDPDGWQVFRNLALQGFGDIIVTGICQYREDLASYTEGSEVAQVLITARKLEEEEKDSRQVTFATLARIPEDAREGIKAAEEIMRAAAEAREKGFAPLDAGDNPGYAATARVRTGQNWSMQRIAEERLFRTVETVSNPGWKERDRVNPMGIDLPMTRLGDIAEVKTSGGKRESPGEKLQTMREARFNCETEPTGTGQEQGQQWSNITMKDSKRSFIFDRDQEAGKAMGAWLRTRMGLMGRWCVSTRDQNGRGQATNPQLRAMPVLDLTRLTREQVGKLAELHDRTGNELLMPACDAWMDDRRLELERKVLEILEVSPQTVRRLENLGILWCLEPTVQGHKGGTKPQAEKMERLQGAAARARAELDDMEAGRKPEQKPWASARSGASHRGSSTAGRPVPPTLQRTASRTAGRCEQWTK